MADEYAFDTEKCDVDAVTRIPPCAAMLGDDTVLSAPAAIFDCPALPIGVGSSAILPAPVAPGVSVIIGGSFIMYRSVVVNGVLVEYSSTITISDDGSIIQTPFTLFGDYGDFLNNEEGSCDGCGFLDGTDPAMCWNVSVDGGEAVDSGDPITIGDDQYTIAFDPDADPPTLTLTLVGGEGSPVPIAGRFSCCACPCVTFSFATSVFYPLQPLFADGDSICERTVTIKVCQTCCNGIPGWDGAGWYCIRSATDPATTPCRVAELVESDMCDTTVIICAGAYTSEAEATAVCGVVFASDCPCGPTLSRRFGFNIPTPYVNAGNYTVDYDDAASDAEYCFWVSATDTGLNPICSSPGTGTWSLRYQTAAPSGQILLTYYFQTGDLYSGGIAWNAFVDGWDGSSVRTLTLIEPGSNLACTQHLATLATITIYPV